MTFSICIFYVFQLLALADKKIIRQKPYLNLNELLIKCEMHGINGLDPARSRQMFSYSFFEEEFQDSIHLQ